MNKRQEKILSYVNKRGEVSVKELLELVGDCSNMTLWRDLAKLEDEGKILRTRGGAAPIKPKETGKEESFLLRVKKNIRAKEEIARIAAPLLNEDRAHFLDAGSTVYTLVNNLHLANYTFITGAVNIASELARGTNNITLLGGQVNINTISNSGPQAEEMLDLINIDVAIMATSGYSARGGFTGGFLPEAQLKAKVLKKSAFSIMLMDSDKVGKSHPFSFGTLKDFDILIGDRNLPSEFIKIATKQGVKVFTPLDGYKEDERIQICSELFSKKYKI